MVSLGIDVLRSSRQDLIAGKRIGIVTNYNVTDGSLRPIVDLLIQDKVGIVEKLFGPEHGMYNCAKEGEEVPSTVDAHSGLTTYSLYGEAYRPTADMLANLDVLIIDLVDIGTRYYTNMNTMAYCLEACAENGLPCLVLDRPNPIGGLRREGMLLDHAFHSFVGMIDVPSRHGLTMGELALVYNQSLAKTKAKAADLTVVPANGWRREMWWQDIGIPFVPPSPNTTHLDMMALYPGTCLFEGTNISEGRGTTHPFELIGAPFIDAFQLASEFNNKRLDGIVARPTYFVPTYKQYVGEVCQGVQLHVTDKDALRPLRAGVELLDTIAHLYPEDFAFTHKDKQGRYFFDLLAGSHTLRELISQGNPRPFFDLAQADCEAFEASVTDCLLYN